MNLLAGETEIGSGRSHWRMFPAGTFAASAGNLTPFLRRVVFIGESPRGHRLDFERIYLTTATAVITSLWAQNLIGWKITRQVNWQISRRGRSK